jgi:hypothetical protein
VIRIGQVREHEPSVENLPHFVLHIPWKQFRDVLQEAKVDGNFTPSFSERDIELGIIGNFLTHRLSILHPIINSWYRNGTGEIEVTYQLNPLPEPLTSLITCPVCDEVVSSLDTHIISRHPNSTLAGLIRQRNNRDQRNAAPQVSPYPGPSIFPMQEQRSSEQTSPAAQVPWEMPESDAVKFIRMRATYLVNGRARFSWLKKGENYRVEEKKDSVLFYFVEPIASGVRVMVYHEPPTTMQRMLLCDFRGDDSTLVWVMKDRTMSPLRSETKLLPPHQPILDERRRPRRNIL